MVRSVMDKSKSPRAHKQVKKLQNLEQKIWAETSPDKVIKENYSRVGL